MAGASAQARGPYLVFETEEEYREHIAHVLGQRLGREKVKAARAQARVAGLEEELASLRRELHTGGTPLHSHEDGF